MDWPHPRLIAHRCGGALAPENTLAGLRKAFELGYRAVEFDVMLSGDGTPVLIHDETLERTTDGRGRVADTSDAELARLDAGSWRGAQFAGEPLPSFG
ncbi:MAG: glycerophosphodiester phosphodiesterase, partial [Rhodocyclaceae bacterium]|nr:glycerophosphodiester phosphodiesterase [Rhodocyclaceae bacterium]